MSGDYIVDPGARLFVGPHGVLEEGLGHAGHGKSCCADCASGKKSCGGGALGAVRGAGKANPFTGQDLLITHTPSGPGAFAAGLPPWAPFAVAGVGVVGLILYLRRRARKNPSRRRRSR